MKSTTSTRKETTKFPPCALWNLDAGSNVCPSSQTILPAQSLPGLWGEGGEPSPHRVIQRCKFFPWMLLVWRIAVLKKGADVTATAAIKLKNTKLVPTRRMPSFLCPQNGIRKSRASINEIISYVTGSSFFVLFWL